MLNKDHTRLDQKLNPRKERKTAELYEHIVSEFISSLKRKEHKINNAPVNEGLEYLIKQKKGTYEVI